MKTVTPIEINVEESHLLGRVAAMLGHVQGMGPYLTDSERGRAAGLISRLLHGDTDMRTGFVVTSETWRDKEKALVNALAEALNGWEKLANDDSYESAASAVSDSERERIAKLRSKFLGPRF